MVFHTVKELVMSHLFAHLAHLANDVLALARYDAALIRQSRDFFAHAEARESRYAALEKPTYLRRRPYSRLSLAQAQAAKSRAIARACAH